MGQEGYGVEALRMTRGDGISGFSSRSDQARARELAKYGLQTDWFDALVEEQGNLCADCHRTEKAKLGNGKRRPLGLGFGEDGQPNRLICTACASAQRKARAVERNAPKDYASFEEFWEVNREQLQKEDALQFATFRERDADIREIYEIIGIYLRSDVRPCYQLSDTLDEIEQELIQNGTTDLDQLSAPFYKVEHRHVFDEILAAAEHPDAPKHARNAAVYAKYGYLQALPVSAGDHVIREFLRRNGRWPFPDWSKPPNPIQTIKCSTYGCKTEFTYNKHDHVPGWYFSPNTNAVVPPPQWFCEKCRAAQVVRKPSGRTLAEVAADRPYAINGKLYTADTTTAPAWFANLAKIPGAGEI